MYLHTLFPGNAKEGVRVPGKGPVLKGFKSTLSLSRPKMREEGKPFISEPNPRT